MPAPPLRGEVEADVVVLGGGLAGLAAAVELARPGRKVVLLEGLLLGSGASGADLGHVATGLGQPYLKAVVLYGRARARALWEWHRESHRRLTEILALLPDDCGYRCRGGFLLAHDRDAAALLAESEDALRDDGFPGEFLDHYMLEARFDVRGFSAAYWSAEDAEVDAPALLRGLAAQALSLGVVLHEGDPIELSADGGGVRVRTTGGRVRATRGVAAWEAAGSALLPSLGPVLPVLAARRLAFEIEAGAEVPSPVRWVEGGLAWRLGPEARELRAAACSSEDPAGEAAFEDLARRVAEALPARVQVRGRWSGALSNGPEGLPLVGEVAGGALFAILGLGSLGPAWAFAAARRAADFLDGRPAAPGPLGPPSGC